jgi:phage tail sheath protein FI
MAEFERYFGGAPQPLFSIKPVAQGASFVQGGQGYALQQTSLRWRLYHGMRHFFQNGGGPCYIVSVGGYSDPPAGDALRAGIDTLAREQEPTLLVVPDAVSLAEADCVAVQQAMLAHCGHPRLRNRFAILDVWGGDQPLIGGDHCVARFRAALGINHLDFGAAYYPWVHTTIVQDRDLDHRCIDAASRATLVALLKADWRLPGTGAAVDDIAKDWAAAADASQSAADQQAWIAASQAMLHKTLLAGSPLYGTLLGEVKNQLNLQPPGAAMAGIYTMVDATRGVWKAPANVSLAGVVRPAVPLSHEDQEDLNVTPQGKSINAIRSFIGEGVLVWGARTLDGNSLDWRYINVRRTMIMLEESCKLAAKAMVFEPNVAGTWVTIKSLVGNFLTSVWKRGGLAGAVPEDAFSVHCGLGETMTPEDILEGVLRVTVLVAVSRPAEFIEITFQQQMQKS